VYQLSATAVRDLFFKGELLAETIAEATLKRIAHCDQKTGAFLSLFSERMMDKAKKLDAKRKAGKPLGKLAAVPVALKDNIHVFGELTTCGSHFLSNYRAVFDATVTRLLEEEDALIVGKTNLDEFAMGSSTEHSAFQLTKNPWNLACSPGGSSGGSAAAVAARLTPLAFGSDTGGSIRQPAALTGITGFKPTYGRVSRFGLVAFGSSLDQIGPLSHHVADAALAMEVIGKHCLYDATSLSLPSEPFVQKLTLPLKGMKIGVPWNFLTQLDTSAKAHFEGSLKVFKDLGCTLVEVDLGALKYAISVYYILATAEASTNLARFDGIRYGNRSKRAATLDEIYDFSREEGFGSEVKRRIMLGTYVLSAGYQDAYYKKAQQVRTLIIERFKAAFKSCQLIATPTSPTSAFEIGKIQNPVEMYLQDIYTIPANLAGLPAISIPSGFCPQGKPLGLHLTGPQLHDAEVLRAAYHFEQTAGFHQKIPPLFNHG
jgi:aspartyl-tRNA(Asn)/glutamyl-tRNA(Gln) amidotransferase subunit A